MQVPQLQFAQMPLVNPRSEMEGFTNALLQAGQMMTQRRQQAIQQQAAQKQQDFQNTMATRQLGLAEQSAEGEAKERSLRISQMEKTSELDERRKAVIKNLQPMIQQISDPAEQLRFVTGHLFQQGLTDEKEMAEVTRTLSDLETSKLQRSEVERKAKAPAIVDGFVIDPNTGGVLSELPLNAKDKMQMAVMQSQIKENQAQAAAAGKSGSNAGMEAMVKAQMEVLKFRAQDQDGAIKDIRNNIFSLKNKNTAIASVKARLAKGDESPDKIMEDLKASNPMAYSLMQGGKKDSSGILKELGEIEKNLNAEEVLLIQKEKEYLDQYNQSLSAMGTLAGMTLQPVNPIYGGTQAPPTMQPAPAPGQPTPEEVRRGIGDKQGKQLNNLRSVIKNAAQKGAAIGAPAQPMNPSALMGAAWDTTGSNKGMAR